MFNFVCDPATLTVAFARVAGNKGARTASVDGIRATDVEASGLAAHLNHIRSALKAGALRPLPVRERMIPKTGGKLRRLGIPTVTDRVVQAALKLVLEPIFEADFRPCSYGFRPNRRAHDAIAEIHLFGSQGYRWVLDIEACFDHIDHAALMDRVRSRVKDKRVLALVKAFLKAGILTELGERNETTSGTPQGGILSPLLANIALSVLDDFTAGRWSSAMGSRRDRERRRHRGLPTWRLVRYADDFVSYASVRDLVRPWRDGVAPTAPKPTPKPPKVRQVAAWMMSRPDDLEDEQRTGLKRVLADCPELEVLGGFVQDFAVTMTERQGHRLQEWMVQAKRTSIAELVSFVAGLSRDLDAVVAGLTLPYSSGVVEGHVNRLKMLKRQMYGRAKPDLLRKRVLAT